MSKWKVLTPKTSFPLRTKPITQEPAIQECINFKDLYQWQETERKDSKMTFTLHDGPPYANGSPHMGHVLNKVLKDFINRYKVLKGFRINYRPGWDCHGLPIELKACHKLPRDSPPLIIRKMAREFAEKTITAQRNSFQRWGIIANWSYPYVTMDGCYEANQIDLFYRMYERGCMYRGCKPVYWSPSSHTALAEAELEYKTRTSTSVYVLFPSLFPHLSRNYAEIYSLIWTTTPWTLPLNKAVCYNPYHKYCLIKLKSSGKVLLIGTEQLEKLDVDILGSSYEILETFLGQYLAEGTYTNPLEASAQIWRPFLEGTHVTSSEGTGLVHTAPAHGFDDYKIGLKHGLDLECLVNENGRYSDKLHGLEGLNVLTAANDEIITRLTALDAILHVSPHVHRYPFDWRTNKPVIIRSTEQWFANVEMLQGEAIKALESVKSTPFNATALIKDMVCSRTEWCISRQRVWGVPIPVFHCHNDHNKVLINAETIDHLKQLFVKHSSDCWWELPISELLPLSLRSVANDYHTGTDTMDVWFDSGSSWATVLANTGGVADMYLEGSDQVRGWFQSSLLTSIAGRGIAPYRQIVTHGFVLDTEGNKMSKSLGNVITPDQIINGYQIGADTMRLWASAGDFKKDTPISRTILSQNDEFLKKIRNTLRFMIGNLAGFDGKTNLIPHSNLPHFDQYMLHLLCEYFTSIETFYETLNFSKIHHNLSVFVVESISALYFDIVKDRLYCDSMDSLQRKTTLTVMFYLLKYLTLSIAPILPHLTEEVNQHYSLTDKGELTDTQTHIHTNSLLFIFDYKNLLHFSLQN